ncbi:MAG: DJ-1/PfpI family protein [Thermoproteota archaeon]
MRGQRVLVLIVVIAVGSITGAYFYTMHQRRASEGQLRGVKVLAIIAEGFDYTEYIGVVNYLRKEGAEITTASFSTKTVSGHGGSFTPEITFNEVNVSVFHVIFIPGGDGPYNIIHNEQNQTVFNILTRALNEGKIVAAICHGPWVLAAADLVNGVRVTCWRDEDMIRDLEAQGAEVDTGESVIRDRNIITANGPAAIEAFSREIVSALAEK